MKRIFLLFTFISSKGCFLFLVFGMMIFLPMKDVSALTLVSNNITTNTVWTKNNSPYIITVPITVKAGVSLQLEPGVIVKGDVGVYVQTFGTFLAEGEANNPIILTSIFDSSFGGDTSSYSSYRDWHLGDEIPEWSGLYFYGNSNATHIIKNTEIYYSGDNYFENTKGNLADIKIKNGDYGVDGYQSEIVISRANFSDMKHSAIINSGGSVNANSIVIEKVFKSHAIKIYDGVNFTGVDLIIKNIENGSGLYAKESVLNISNSSFENINGDGIGLWGGRASLKKIEIKNVTESGLKVSGTAVSGENLNIHDNSVGISNILGGGGPVLMGVLGGDLSINSGSSSNLIISNSRIVSNDFGAINEVGLSEEGYTELDLRNNWWGDVTGPLHQTKNSTGLGNEVSDGVLFLPWLKGDPANPEPQIPDPVIIIPGILGSAEKNGVWVIDPIFHTYDDLIATLDANGYEMGKDLFTFPYNWRYSNVLTAYLLEQKIKEVKEICKCDKVDLVAHSMGGLVARQYVQSDRYKGDVDQLIFLGTPHLGAPKAYLPWEGGAVPPKDVAYSVLKLILSGEASKLNKDLFDYLHESVVSVGQLLPTYEYLRDKDSSALRIFPIGYPWNQFLIDLNLGVNKLYNSGVRLTNIVGNTGTTTVSVIRVVPYSGLKLWEDGYPDGFEVGLFSDNGLEKGLGDDTVPLYSSSYISGDLITVANTHIDLPRKTEGIAYKKLTGKDATTLVQHGLKIDFLMLIKMLSPADFQVIAPNGKKIGKNFETSGEYDEIPGAFYSGFQTDDEYVTIPNPLDGEYKVVTQGTDSGGGYTVATGYISDSGTVENNFTGQTLPGMINNIDIKISSTSPEVIKIMPEDNIPPVIIINSPVAKDYLRSETLLINATTTDSGSGVFNFDMTFDKKDISNASRIDLFYEKLGSHNFSATSSDFMLNVATSSVGFRVIATSLSTISDIERAYALGWIKDKKTRDVLIRGIKAMTKIEKKFDKIIEKVNGKKIEKRIEKLEEKIDKVLARVWKTELKIYLKGKIINQQGHDLLQEDIQWLIDHN